MWLRRTCWQVVAFGSFGAVAVASEAQPTADEGPYRLAIAYTGEAWRAVDGGIETGSSYLDRLDVMLGVDLDRTLRVPVTIFAHGLYNNGHSISALVGDAQGVSSNEAVRAVRLYELWAEWRLGAQSRHTLRYGVYDANSEFDVVPSAGLFVGSSHGMGREFSQTGEHGPSTYPVTSLAVRYRWQLNDAWYTQVAALDGVPGDPHRPEHTKVHLSSDEGALLIGEIARESSRVTKLALGVWHYTAEFADSSALDEHGDPTHRRGNSGAYVLADAALIEASTANAGERDPRLSAFLRFGVADGHFNRFDRYLGAGLVWRGLLSADAEDELGLAVAVARNGDTHRRLSAQFGATTDRAETNIELTWRVPVNDWLTLQPDLQYVLNPGTNPDLRNAWVVGLRFEVRYLLMPR